MRTVGGRLKSYRLWDLFCVQDNRNSKLDKTGKLDYYSDWEEFLWGHLDKKLSGCVKRSE